MDPNNKTRLSCGMSMSGDVERPDIGKGAFFFCCRQGFVPAESVMNFRKELGCDTFSTEEKGKSSYLLTHTSKKHQ